MENRTINSVGLILLRLAIVGSLFSPALLNAQDDDEQPSRVDVKAVFNRRAIEPNESVTLTVIVESNGRVEIKPFELPAQNDFAVGGHSEGSEVSATLRQNPKTGAPQFVTVNRAVFHWELSPRRLGELTFFPIEVMVDGRSYRTNAVKVQVASGAGRGQARRGGGARPAPDDPTAEDDEMDLFSQLLRRGMRNIPQGGSRTLPANPNEAFFIQVETDKTEAFVGEQITVSYYLYTTGMIRDLDTLKYPALKGFWKEDIEIATHLNFQQEVVDGVPYKKALLASYALFPIKEGPATIDSYQAKCTVIPGADLFGALGMGRAYTFTKTSTPIKVNVKALPAAGRPADFSGAVGDFQVTARVEDRNVIAGQPFPLKIRFEGRGNAKLIDIPPFQPPEGMELYDTQKEAKFFGWGTSFKEFTLQLIPRREGEFVIPPIGASMFDPQTQKYVSRKTEELRIRVGQGTGAGATSGSESFTGSGRPSAAATAAKEKVFVPAWRESLATARAWTLTQAAAGVGGLYALVLAGLLLVAAREFSWGRRGQRLSQAIKRRIHDLEALAKKAQAREVGVRGVNLLAYALGGVVSERVQGREVIKLLRATTPSIQTDCGAQIESALQTFELLAFAPDAVIASWQDAAKLKELVSSTAKTLDRVVALSGSDEQSSESR